MDGEVDFGNMYINDTCLCHIKKGFNMFRIIQKQCCLRSLEKYAEGMKRFIKALNLYRPLCCGNVRRQIDWRYLYVQRNLF
ncbi:hypothetical protein SPSYN_02905 [Sporotomaculum syntrophicum]|uniref:Uncharacterized protein n=1 Tax=Sporotomaculum syntrophicum TaxID=182264 RepID=A0A9D2WMM3_9FIRM|nr:hypothetical protein SPSYN_02905 [Sporotomaculum syntrophicum]